MDSLSSPQLSEGVKAEKVEGDTVNRFQECLDVFPNGFIRLMPFDQVSFALLRVS